MRSRAAKQVHRGRSVSVLVVAVMAALTCAAPTRAAAVMPAQVPPPFTASPTSFVFPPTQVGQQSPPQQLVVTNTGSSPQLFRVYGWPELPLQVTGCDQPVPPNQSCTAQLVFAPIAGGPRSYGDGRVRIDADSGGLQLPLTLQWLPLVSDPAPPIDFGAVQDGTTSAAKTITLRNFWEDDTTISDLSFPAGSRFAISSSTCGGPISSGATCTVSATYTPGRHVGPDSATLIATGPWGVGNTEASEGFEFTAEGVAAPIISVSPTSVSFLTEQQVGTSSAPQLVTVRNTGTAPLNLVYQTTGPSHDEFPTSGCDVTTLPVNQSCEITVAFMPLYPGIFPRQQTSLWIYDLQLQSVSVTIPFTTGRVLPLDFDPRSVTFPDTRVGEASAPVTIRARNYNTETTPVSGYRLASEDFAVNSFTCSPQMASGAYCDIVVVFEPTKAGATSTDLIIFGPFYGEPAQEVVRLSGTGVSQLSLPDRPPPTSPPARGSTTFPVGTLLPATL